MASLLSCKKMITDLGVTGDYLIEWRLNSRNGPAVFISGEGSDPLIQAYHPFANEPVISGVLYPVLKYAYFDGYKYTLDYEEGSRWSPDFLNCLNPPITIDSVNCSTGVAGTYSHAYAYNNTQDPAVNAYRTIKFDLNSDGTTRFYAWNFYAIEVVDRIRILYYHINDINNPSVVTDWKVGTNLPGNYVSDLNSIPKKLDFSSVSVVNDLTQYNHVSGDYLIIEITPRTEEPNNINTNWSLKLKCLDSFPDNNVQPGMRTLDPSTVTIAYDDVKCRYIIRYKTLVPYTLPSHYRNYLYTRWLTYCESNWDYYTWYKLATQEYFVFLAYRLDWTTSYINSGTNCYPLNGSLNISKVGNILTYTFTNSADYSIYKTSYNTIVNNASWLNQGTDPDQPKYYNAFYIKERIAATCGDSYTPIYEEIWRESPFVFNDANRTITITLTTFTINTTKTSCNSHYDNVVATKNAVDSFINKANYSVNTNIRYDGFIGRVRAVWDRRETAKGFNFSYFEENQKIFENPIPTGWKNIVSYWGTNVGFGFDMGTGLAEITNINDPLNNFRIRWKLNEDGTYQTSSTIVYEKQNGVQIIP